MEVTDQHKNPAAEAPDMEAVKKEAVKASQERIAAILGAPEAEGRQALAKELAFKTSLSVEDAKGIMAAAPQAQANPLAQAMEREPNPEVGVEAGGEGASPVQAMLNSMQAKVTQAYGSEMKGGIQ